MKRVLLAVAMGAGVGACTVSPRIGDDGSVCAEARALMGGCGVTLSILSVRECTGPSQAVAECVVENADTCEGLAGVRFDECVGDLLDPIAEDPLYEPLPEDPGTPLPTPPVDPVASEDTNALCDDGVDNDGDGFIDCDDVDCSQADAVTVCREEDG